jgi:tetratricopeptide (TPR) repeat protein
MALVGSLLLLLALLPLAFGPLTLHRPLEWRTDATLFEAALARDPDNDAIAFRLAYDLHARRGDCASAQPLDRRTLAVDPRAGTNLQACLLDAGRFAEALALAPELLARSEEPPPRSQRRPRGRRPRRALPRPGVCRRGPGA